jgi:hypothetical protein
LSGGNLTIEFEIAEFELLIGAMEEVGHPLDTYALAKLGRALAKMFSVDQDEVAILTLNTKLKNLKFVIPEKLSEVGTIPLTSSSALASRTARENRADLMNNFGTTRHATVFEGVPLGRKPGELIQKIMSAPILNDEKKVHGVVQISRKGKTPTDAGPDFTQKELRTLVQLSPSLHRFLNLYHAVLKP